MKKITYTQSLLKGNETLTKKVEKLEKELSEAKHELYIEKITNKSLREHNYKLQVTIDELNKRVKELETVQDPIRTLLDMGKNLQIL